MPSGGYSAYARRQKLEHPDSWYCKNVVPRGFRHLQSLTAAERGTRESQLGLILGLRYLPWQLGARVLLWTSSV